MSSIRFMVVAGALASLVDTAGGQAKFEYRQGGQLEGVFFLDASLGWTAEDGGRIRRTIDGGQTWFITDVPDDVRGELRGVYFLNQDDGWAEV